MLEKLENDENVDAVDLDFTKIFDKVDQSISLQKARRMGITGKLGIMLHSFLADREQCAAPGGAMSQLLVVSSQTPQESVPWTPALPDSHPRHQQTCSTLVCSFFCQ